MTSLDLSGDFSSLAAVVLLLGIKHGFDADHLAAIDGMTRFNSRQRPRLARLAGTLFSLGHGLVVTGVALSVSTLASTWRVPPQLESLGAWVSITVLVMLAIINLRTLKHTPRHEVASPVGWRSGALARLLTARSPLAVLGVGMVFAISFDTLSQATLFAVTATHFGGWQHALSLAGLFVGGMLITDGINGLWISRLIRRADAMALVASRTMTLAVAAVGLMTAGWGVARQTLPALDPWAAGRAWWFSAAIVVAVFTSYLLGRRLASVPPAP